MTNVPAHLEADLLALIEDQPLEPSREAAVRAAVAADPALARLVSTMRADRAQVIALGACSAPADLLERVETVLEREALLGAASLEAEAPAPIPISRVQIHRRGVGTLLRQHRWAASLAMAACLAIVAGASLMIFRNPGPKTSGSTIAHAGNTGAPGESRDLMKKRDGTGGPAVGGVDQSGASDLRTDAMAGTPAEPMREADFGASQPGDSGAGAIEAAALAGEVPESGDPKKALAEAAPANEEKQGPGGGMAARNVGMDRAQNISRGQSAVLNEIENDTAGDRDENARRESALRARTYPIIGRALTTSGGAEGVGDDTAPGGAPATAASITADEAAVLLRQGRLAVRLSAPTLEQAEQSLRAARRKFDQISEPAPLEPVQLGAALAVLTPERDASPVPMSDVSPPGAPPAPPTTAATTTNEGERGRSLPGVVQPATSAAPANTVPVTPPAPPPSPTGFEVTLPVDAASLERFVSAISVPGQRVEFIELPAAATTERLKDKSAGAGHDAPGIAAPLDPAMIIWWTSPVRVWAVRAKLPVVVQPAP